MSTILPKGIVFNSPEIEDDIQSVNFDRLGTADITKMWKVYTTTTRKLHDPTARRLENFWWRIWGSQRRELQAVTIAGIFAVISSERSFVPLGAPGSRHESSSSPESKTQEEPESEPPNPDHQPPTQSRTTSSSTVPNVSAVIPHPILKKTRGPSASGPRPTARFISPHESGDEAEEGPSESKNKNVVLEPPSPTVLEPAEQKATPHVSGKKKPTAFVASSSTRKRRPVMGRRQSSSTSQSSVGGRSPERSSIGNTIRSRSPRSLMAEKPAGMAVPKTQLQEHQSHVAQASTSTGSTERRISPRKEAALLESLGRAVREISAEGTEPSQELQSTQSRPSPTFRELSAAELEAIEAQNRFMGHFDLRTGKSASGMASKPTIELQQDEWSDVPRGSRRSKSDGSLATERLLPDRNQAKSRASLAPTLTSAVGHLGLGDATFDQIPEELRTLPEEVGEGRVNKGKGKVPGNVPRLGSFSKTSIPATISEEPGSSGGLGDISKKKLEDTKKLTKSQSHLTLLLEKDKARGGEASKQVKKKGKR